MSPYNIRFTPIAEQDLNELYDYVAYELSLPITAQKYRAGILETIDSLAEYADAHPISQREYLQAFYGPFARTIRYKKMSIIYNIIGSQVLIRRIIAGSLIQ
jgi:plasmid stabilization system protein ParE